ncbi:hypothetical protein [Compostimonas suwonensis]|uniref:Uncharacterized protein n=1 Tax=Compostimonas suwonensis TaxID=1048394 RepID=A0A2M9BWK1_9MICO|nr:hypothetical protein [Compostimonas suwonensis]PJJ62309.1 hypothetical protein CLV54_2109 [Compostimonas suwonensis]
MNPDLDGGSRVILLWLPVGAGGHVVVHTSRWWELLQAMIEHRRPQPLFHAALEVVDRGERFVIEMTPAWGVPAAERGVVANGPVGIRWLGRSRYFRYEVRCWPDGIIPDRQWAVGEPAVLTRDADTVRRLLERVPQVPTLTWGRIVRPTGDMWNSNSLISWLLAGVGIPAELHPPNGRAPGWAAGLAVAAREGAVLP